MKCHGCGFGNAIYRDPEGDRLLCGSCHRIHTLFSELWPLDRDPIWWRQGAAWSRGVKRDRPVRPDFFVEPIRIEPTRRDRNGSSEVEIAPVERPRGDQ